MEPSTLLKSSYDSSSKASSKYESVQYPLRNLMELMEVGLFMPRNMMTCPVGMYRITYGFFVASKYWVSPKSSMAERICVYVVCALSTSFCLKTTMLRSGQVMIFRTAS